MNIIFPTHIPKKRHHKGDLRDDGLVFWRRKKGCVDNEQWVSVDQYREWTERARERYNAALSDPEAKARNLEAVRRYRAKKAEPKIPRMRLPKTITLWELNRP